MSIPISQKVDLLYKQAFGVTKTDTEANKSPSNEAIASPLLIRGDTQWTQSDQIPGVAAATAGIVQAYTGTGAAECTADNTTVPVSGVYPTWKTGLTYWIPAEFGSTYSVSVYVDDAGVADPTSTGTQIFGAGSGGTGEFFYNYQSGVLNFIGETIPTALTSSKVLYIVGYRYIGSTGVTNLPDGTQIGNLSITDQTVTGQDTDANIILTPNGTGQVVTSGNVTASFFYGNGSQLTGIDTSGVANGTSNVRIPAADGNIELNVDGALTANVTDTGIVMTGGNLNLGNVIATGVGTFTGNVGAGNVDGGNLVSANFFTGTLIDGTSNVTVTNNGNIDLVAAGNSTAVISGTGANVVGTLNANGVATLGSVVTAQVTGAGSGNLTLTAIDGITLNTDDRIVIKDEATSANNGIYTYTSSTVLTRATDFDTPTEMAGGDFIFIQQGTTLNDTGFVMTDPVVTVGTSDVTFVQFSGAGSFTAGSGLTLTGTVFSVNTDNLTTDISGGNVVVKTSAQFTTPDIGAATGTSLSATGNVAGGNLTTAGVVSATGNVIGGNITTAGVVAATGNVSGGNITTGAKVVAVGNIDSTSGIFNGDGFGLSNIPAANITGLSLSGIANGTSNVDIAAADGNISMGVNGVADIVIVADDGIEVTGTTKSSGTVTASAFTANTGIFTGNGSGLTALTGANVTGEVPFAATANAVAGGNVSGQVANALVSGTVYTAAQPNVTSVGTLTSVSVSGTANVAGNVNVGANEISTLAAATVTTTSTSQQAIASFAVSGVNGVEFLVKGIDATSGNVSVASVLSVTDGSTVDFVTYGQSFLTGSAGVLAVGLNGADLELLVTPAATDSTVWTTQYRFI